MFLSASQVGVYMYACVGSYANKFIIESKSMPVFGLNRYTTPPKHQFCELRADKFTARSSFHCTRNNHLYTFGKISERLLGSCTDFEFIVL